METLESQFMRILNKISEPEKMRNRALERQTSKLLRALLYLKMVQIKTVGKG